MSLTIQRFCLLILFYSFCRKLIRKCSYATSAIIIVYFILLFPKTLISQNPEWILYNKVIKGLPSNNINAIVIDKQGNHWIGTHGNGLVKFDGVNWTTYNKNNSQTTK